MWQLNSRVWVATVLLLTALLGSATRVRAADTGGIAVVIKVKGTVTYQAPQAESWEPVTQGLVLPSGTSVKTAADGLAMVKFLADGSMMRLKPQTHLTLAAREKKGGMQVSLGSVLFDIKKSKARDKFTVSTPTSIATVKGTKFWVIVRADSSTVLVGLDGVVSLECKATGKARNVKKGYTGIVDGSGLKVRETQGGDLPEGEDVLNLEFGFKDEGGGTKTLRIESNQVQ
jgi:hypothetical protein